MDQVLNIFIDGILVLHKSLKLPFYTLREPGKVVSTLKLGGSLRIATYCHCCPAVCAIKLTSFMLSDVDPTVGVEVRSVSQIPQWAGC